MSLTKLCKSGGVFSMDKSTFKIPSDIRFIYKRISDHEKLEIFDFISKQVANQQIFNLATVFGDQKLNWNNTPIMKLYQLTGNEKLAAIVLGYLTMECLILDEHEWGCIKTDITKRDFETNSYFRLNDYTKAA